MDRCSIMSMPLMMAWVLMMGVTVISFADAQVAPPCAIQLSPCLDYLNSTNPPAICCNPIKEIDATQKTCFCELGFHNGILEGYGINTAQAIRLVHLCGVNLDIMSFCKVSSSASASPPSSVQPPATPGSEEGGVGRVTFTGLSFVLFLWACVLF